MCIKCNFLLQPFPPHKATECPLLLQCAYCNVCGVYNDHFPTSCPKRARGALPLNAHLREGWKNANDVAEPNKEKIFRMVDDEETYKEYCKTHNIVLAQTLEGLRQKVTLHLQSRGYKRETYKEGLSVYTLPFEEEQVVTAVEMPTPIEMPAPVERVPSKRKLKPLKKLSN